MDIKVAQNALKHNLRPIRVLWHIAINMINYVMHPLVTRWWRHALHHLLLWAGFKKMRNYYYRSLLKLLATLMFVNMDNKDNNCIMVNIYIPCWLNWCSSALELLSCFEWSCQQCQNYNFCWKTDGNPDRWEVTRRGHDLNPRCIYTPAPYGAAQDLQQRATPMYYGVKPLPDGSAALDRERNIR